MFTNGKNRTRLKFWKK